jgi:hypothetical protein
VYDGLSAPPRVEEVRGDDPRALIETLSARVYNCAREAGGSLPYTVIREIVENLIHAEFYEVVVTVMDDGRVIRFSDQGPGIPDKERAFLPGFSTATTDMKTVIKGVGSGLPVARECVSFSGGTIEVDDNLGSGTVVTLRGGAPAPKESSPLEMPEPPPEPESPPLSLRQKQILSLAMELGVIGPTGASRELGIGLSTAYRDLAQLESFGLIEATESGKRMLTDGGVRYLDTLFGR